MTRLTLPSPNFHTTPVGGRLAPSPETGTLPRGHCDPSVPKPKLCHEVIATLSVLKPETLPRVIAPSVLKPKSCHEVTTAPLHVVLKQKSPATRSSSDPSVLKSCPLPFPPRKQQMPFKVSPAPNGNEICIRTTVMCSGIGNELNHFLGMAQQRRADFSLATLFQRRTQWREVSMAKHRPVREPYYSETPALLRLDDEFGISTTLGMRF
ncbi:hypothetical protein AVEN_208473-1 [Araneus ventricosus]|uniref:Uncharacterized protein n=1 Tax=Araneus ventricosus TaxID=182803 RepID=A0A4Y2TYX4_ARAVE|nr:hypothetical protein AVEN_208473-1 [Araneus ventricosus]